jgi:hypothetical protein
MQNCDTLTRISRRPGAAVTRAQRIPESQRTEPLGRRLRSVRRLRS